MTTYSIVILTYRRDDVIEENLARLSKLVSDRSDVEVILIDNNADGVDRSHLVDNFAQAKLTRPDRNLGVAGGRNIGIRESKGSVLLFLDDDALIWPQSFLLHVAAAFERYPQVGIQSFKSINFYTRKMVRKEFPHTDKSKPIDAEFLTFRFIGVAHAIKKEVFDRVGLYYDDFFYGSEEFDLSYRAIKAGYQILYNPEVWVEHKVDERGRLPSAQMWERVLTNKLKVGYMHLPQLTCLLNAIAWMGYVLAKSRGRANIWRAYRAFQTWATGHRDARKPMDMRAVAYVRACGGQLWK